MPFHLPFAAPKRTIPHEDRHAEIIPSAARAGRWHKGSLAVPGVDHSLFSLSPRSEVLNGGFSLKEDKMREKPNRAAAGRGRLLSSAGFSLIEMLAVMTVIVIVMVFVTPAFTGVVRGSRLTEGGQMMQDRLAFYRQQALAKNRIVEVRFYRSVEPGLVNNSNGPSYFRAVQGFELSEDHMNKWPLDKPAFLPTAIIVDSGKTLSSLVTAHGTEQDSSTTDPQLYGVTSYKYVYFQFNPDGSAALTPRASSWFLTLHQMSDGDGLGNPPSNYYTIQINPFNGHTSSFRP